MDSFQTAQLPENNTEFEPTVSKKNNLYIFVVTFILGTVIGAVVVGWSEFSINKTNQDVVECSACDPVETNNNTEFISNLEEQDNYISFRETLRQVTAGEVSYRNTDTGVELFSAEFPLSDGGAEKMLITLEAYKYIPGATLQAGYEGIDLSRDLDSEVTLFKSLQPGTRVVTGPTTIFGSPDVAITASGFEDDVKFAFFDWFFPPSRTYIRNYYIWQEESQQMLEVSVGINEFDLEVIEREICDDQVCATMTIYSTEVEQALEKIERLFYTL